MNYAAHNKELDHTLELAEPTIFMKSDSFALLPGRDIPGVGADMPTAGKHLHDTPT